MNEVDNEAWMVFSTFAPGSERSEDETSTF